MGTTNCKLKLKQGTFTFEFEFLTTSKTKMMWADCVVVMFSNLSKLQHLLHGNTPTLLPRNLFFFLFLFFFVKASFPIPMFSFVDDLKPMRDLHVKLLNIPWWSTTMNCRQMVLACVYAQLSFWIFKVNPPWRIKKRHGNDLKTENDFNF